jgi:alpha-D-ribose 1-methylphosphonate 5-triphosphate synthase subunit PhnL
MFLCMAGLPQNLHTEGRNGTLNILEIRGLKKDFTIFHANKTLCSCSDISLTLKQGGFTGIVGLSGAGKSTILRCIYRTYLTSSGDIWYDSKALGRINLSTAGEREILLLRKQEIGYVSQFLTIMPRVTAREHVESALLSIGADESCASQEAAQMLAYFRLPQNLWDIYPNTFSGGERLRLNLAHAMVKKPRLLLLDEPTASLDITSKILVKDILLSMKKKGTSMIGIFHDLEFMEGLCDEVLNLSNGRLVEEKAI